MYLLDEASKQFSTLRALTPTSPTTQDSYSTSMSMAAGSAGLQTVSVQVGLLLFSGEAVKQLLTLVHLPYPNRPIC